jgi:ribonuclease HI
MKEDGITIHTDGGARGNPGPAACAFVVEVGGKIIQEDSSFLGDSTNNYAEYQGVILAMQWLAGKSQISNLKSRIVFNLDSELVVKQLNGIYKIKNQILKDLNDDIKRIIKENGLNIVFKNIPRAENKTADFLVNKELDKDSKN